MLWSLVLAGITGQVARRTVAGLLADELYVDSLMRFVFLVVEKYKGWAGAEYPVVVYDVNGEYTSITSYRDCQS